MPDIRLHALLSDEPDDDFDEDEDEFEDEEEEEDVEEEEGTWQVSTIGPFA